MPADERLLLLITCSPLQIWYYTSGILLEAGFVQEIVPYITLSTGGIETLAAIVSVSFIHIGSNIKTGYGLVSPPLQILVLKT